jgi:hypothetical protein
VRALQLEGALRSEHVNLSIVRIAGQRAELLLPLVCPVGSGIGRHEPVGGLKALYRRMGTGVIAARSFALDWPVETSMAQPFDDLCGVGIINAEQCPRELGRKIPAPRRRVVLAACVLASSMAFIDSSVLTVALPSLRAALRETLAFRGPPLLRPNAPHGTPPAHANRGPKAQLRCFVILQT